MTASLPSSPNLGASTEHIDGVLCVLHRDIAATFYCKRCIKPFCDQCKGDSEGAKSFCEACSKLRQDRKEEPVEKEEIKHHSSLKPILLTIAALFISYNVFTIYTNQPVLREAAALPPISKQTAELITCRHQLESLSALAQQHLKTKGVLPDLPSDLSMLVNKKSSVLCPITHLPYIVQQDPDTTLIVSCPDPEAHGLKSLFATPAKPAQMHY
jgi:hypothetical protein